MRAQGVVTWLAAGLLLPVAVLSWAHWRPEAPLSQAATWQKMTMPGQLSPAHAFLANQCASCHTPIKGVRAINCIACHANDRSLLQRQPTAFHADVQSCVECHTEHQGPDRRPPRMDHAALATVSLWEMSAGSGIPADNIAARKRIIVWIDQRTRSDALPPGHPTAAREEAVLNCTACHSNQDRHRGLFGTDCIQCHTTTVWTVPEFRHPLPTSTSCAQCHQAPPSHYMMHFQMVSMTVARQEHAQVNQCFLCHQTNDWNDIKGVGWYKHH